MLQDLPTDLHLLILEHDEEKKRLKEENQRLKAQVKMTQLILLGPQRVFGPLGGTGHYQSMPELEILPSEMYRYYRTFGVIELQQLLLSLGLPIRGTTKQRLIKSLIEYYLD